MRGSGWFLFMFWCKRPQFGVLDLCHALAPCGDAHGVDCGSRKTVPLGSFRKVYDSTTLTGALCSF